MRYYIYRPTVRGVKRWGYWFYDENNKKKKILQNPQTGKRFETRRDIENWIRYLERRDDSFTTSVTVDDISSYLFEPGSPWIDRQTRRRDGRPLAQKTIEMHRHITKTFITPRWKDVPITDVTSTKIEDWLYSLEASNRYRTLVAQTFAIILREAKRKGAVETLPAIEMPQGKAAKPYIPTQEELFKLFPATRGETLTVWPYAKNHGEKPEAGLMHAAMNALMFFGGLRPQEARAVHMDQIIAELGAVLITRSMDSYGRVVPYAKKGSKDDPRYRGTLLPDRALRILGWWLDVAKPTGLAFTANGGPVSRWLLYDRLKAAAANAGIKDKRIIPYSGRYTFVSTVKPLIDRAALMAMTGHVDDAMPERYDIPYLTERMRQLQPIREALNVGLN